jgi:hypothetical protein
MVESIKHVVRIRVKYEHLVINAKGWHTYADILITVLNSL